MKYLVTDPRNSSVWIYEQKNNGRGWTVQQPPGAPILEHATSSAAPTLIDAVLEEHRRKGRIVEEIDADGV